MTEPTPADVRAAALALVSEANRAAGLVAGLKQAVERNAVQARTQAAKVRENGLRAAAEQARRGASASAGAAAALAQMLAPGVLSAPWSPEVIDREPEVLAVADHVRVGTARLSVSPTDVVTAPVIVPWLDNGSLIIRAGAAHTTRARSLAQEILLRSLLATGAGQLGLSSFDPELSPTLAPFAPLRQAREDLISVPAAEPSELADLLDHLAHDVRRITDMYRGERTNLGSFRRATGQPIESFEVVTILNYPHGFTPELNTRLATLMRTGPACGISFLVHHDPDAPVPDRVDPAAVLSEGRLIDLSSSKMKGFEGFDVRYGQFPDSSLVEAAIARLDGRVRRAAAPRIDFDALQPTVPWQESSADRLVATIGRVGHESIDIVLGDETDQRHNVLVTGAVGQGKSNLLMALIHSWAIRYSPQEVQMYLLDFKDGVTLYPLARHQGGKHSWLPHARVLGLESDRAYGLAVLQYVVTEFERRAAIIKPYGDNITRYRAARPDAVMPRIVVLIDEFQVLFEHDDATAAESLLAIERLARKGRAYGIHLVLASQTLSGITGLVAKKDGIFSQFPIRLALHNSATESRAVLSQNNTEAARLRYRGEVVVNRDFGEVEANTRGVVALADPARLEALRTRLVELDGGTHVPSTFDGGRLALYAEAAVPHEPHVALGQSIGVDPAPVWAPFNPAPGRHLSILGTGNRQPGGCSAPAQFLSVAARSLADTSKPGWVEFWLLDILADNDPDRAAIDALEMALREAGYLVRRADRASAAGLLHEAVAEAEARRTAAASTALHLIIFGVDRIPQMTVADFTKGGQSPLDYLHLLWQEGVPYDIHVLGWWANAKNYQDHTTNRGKGGLVDVIALFRVAPDAVHENFGPFVQWRSPDLRVLVRDVALDPDPMVLVPFSMTAAPVNEPVA